MAASRICKVAVALSFVFTLASCEDGQNPFTTGGSSGTGANGDPETTIAAVAGETVERDVEAPDVFSATDEGLWDGRPSLGGIWVAHPNVTGPERVSIRNVATGRETTGALFRREREMPGPSIQVSSDAAAALGMIAGAPAELRVVALRRERVEVAPPSGEAIASGEIEATPLDTSAPAASATAASAAPTSRDRPAARPSQPAAQPAPSAPAAPPASGNPQSPAPQPAAPAQSGSTAAAPAATAPAEAPAQAPLAGGSFVQVGIFSQKSNADSTADALRGAGMVPTVREQQSNDRTVWRVLVGPVATASDRAALLEKVRDLGFADAYVIRN